MQPDGSPPAGPSNLAPAQYLFVDINTVAERLTDLAKGRDRIFWVRWFESDTDPRGVVPFLLEKFGTLRVSAAFRGFDVASYQIAPDTRFELAPGLNDAAVDFGDQVQLIGSAFGGGDRRHSDAAATRLAGGRGRRGGLGRAQVGAAPGRRAAAQGDGGAGGQRWRRGRTG